MSDKQERPIVWRLVKAAGGRGRIARKLGIAKSTPGQWIARNKVPDHYIVDLCEMTKGVFQPHQISPEVFGPEVRV